MQITPAEKLDEAVTPGGAETSRRPPIRPDQLSDRDVPRWVNLLLDVVMVFNPLRLNRMLNEEGIAGLRARLPFSLFAGLVTVAFSAIPFALVVVHAQLLSTDPGFRERAGWPAMILLPLFGGAMVTLLLGLIELVGWLSGYRAFRGSRVGVATPDAVRLITELEARAEAQGVVVKKRLARPGFVGVRLSRRIIALFHETGDVPLLVACRFVPRDEVSGEVVCLVKSHTLVLWDTGERVACEKLGAALLGQSSLEQG